MSTLFSEDVRQFIIENASFYTTSKLTKVINGRFGTNYRTSQLYSYKQNHRIHSGISTRFTKGHQPYNKGMHICAPGCERTWFIKGHVPENHKTVGTEVIDRDGYIKVKTAEPNVWRFKHELEWEKVNGPRPEGYVLIFLDGNRQNVDTGNLKLITRKENAVLNKNHLRCNSKELTNTAVLCAEVIIAKGELIKQRNSGEEQNGKIDN